MGGRFQNPEDVKGMECLHCKGELIRGKVPYGIHRKGYHFVLDAAPALVYQQCGEPMFDSEDVKAIQQLKILISR
jgi:YgiT-type zinc finger domain-containing protein